MGDGDGNFRVVVRFFDEHDTQTFPANREAAARPPKPRNRSI
jgi:hypothetical protein